jgi:hypothetical protein
MFKLRILDEILKMAAFSAGSVMAVLLLCEYILKPLWHIITQGQ